MCYGRSRRSQITDHRLKFCEASTNTQRPCVLAKLTMLIYVHALLWATQYVTVKAQSSVCEAAIFFTVISSAARVGWPWSEPNKCVGARD